METSKKTLFINAIDWIKKTRDVIDFAHQIENAIYCNSIKPKDIIKASLITPENVTYTPDQNWTKNTETLRNDFANIIKVNTVSFQIILLKESYTSLFINSPYGLTLANKLNEPDLWAAQAILKHIRNALGHMKANKSGSFAEATWDFKNNKPPGKLEVAGVILDTTNLHGITFKWSDLGGITNFFKVLDFLREDLEKRISDICKTSKEKV